jgi:hypothetical protein
MEPFFVLLVLGALVLIAITVVIVWPARPTLQLVEAPTSAMSDASLPPQGDRFEDQYTSATADLSAGGVAAALRNEPPAAQEWVPAPATPRSESWPAADTRSEPIELPARAESFRYPVAKPSTTMRPSPVVIGIATGVVLSIASAIVGAWVFSRWQRRKKLIERLLNRR